MTSDPGLNIVDWMARDTLLKAGFAERTANSATGPQTYFAAGAGRPVVLLHGAGDHAGSWAQAGITLLGTGRYRVVIPDLAGRGKSAPLEGPVGMKAILSGLDGVLAGEEPLTLVGNSLGAWVAMVWMSRHAERVARIVAVNGGAISGIRPDLSLAPKDREEASRLWEAMVDRSRWEIQDIVYDELIRKGKVGAISRMDTPEMLGHLMDGRLREITAPVDLIWGESDRLVPLEYAQRMLACLPRATLTTIAGCGHVPHLECPARFCEVLLAVLDRTP